MGSETLFEPYLEKVRDLTKIPIDILRREVNMSGIEAKKISTKVQESVTPTEKGDEKAIKFLLASLLHKKNYVDERIDYQKLLCGYKKYLDIINLNLPLSSVFDIEGANEDRFLMEILTFNFAEFEEDEERYFKECLWKIAEANLKNLQQILNEQYKNCQDINDRSVIAQKLGKIALQLKNKSLEEFYGRR